MIKFGTGGWRAIIGDDFTRENIQILAAAMAAKIKAEGVQDTPVCIGYDRRFLSKETVYWVCEVLAAENIPVLFVNRSVPSPMVMYYVEKHDLAYGMMVTASHNPSLYNGIKVFTRGGRDADEVQTKDIERYIALVNPAEIKRMDYAEAKASGIVKEFYPLNEYVDNIINCINMDAIREAGLKVVMDPMYGVGEPALGAILHTARCDVDVIHGNHDTLFGRKLPAPTAEGLKELAVTVVDNGFDVGIAMDGDADRLGVIDEKGRYLHPNEILCLLYYYLVKYKGWQGPAVRNLATSHRLDRIAESFGQVCHEVPVGFKHISAKITEADAVLGGESSGGLTVRGHIKGKDGVYAASLIVEMIAVIGKPLSEIGKDLDKLYGPVSEMVELGFKFSQAKKDELYDLLFVQKQLPNLDDFEVDHVSYFDGCKVYFKNGGWIIARFSGTEPLIRVFCEMPSDEDAKTVSDRFVKFLGL